MPQLLRSLFSRAFVNPFPAANMPSSMTEAMSNPELLNPYLPVGARFRGRLNYDRAKCIGCRLCVRVCPAHATDYQAEEKKIIIHNDRCCFCAQCTEVCPVKCLTMSKEFMISSYDRKANVVKDSGSVGAAPPAAKPAA
jgi:formate hydrogenlyase subunit 6/NADH:ubiquinone oxidoreductase subunit I